MTERVLLHVMSRDGNHRDTIQWLLSVGIDINERSEDLMSLGHLIAGAWLPWTPLQLAAWQEDLDLIHQLIGLGADVNEPPYQYGATALQAAAERGSFGIVQTLLELGADPDAPGFETPQGRTAIERAAEHGRLDIVQLLLNSGVETNGSGRRQYVRSVALAEKGGHHAIKKLLQSHAGWTDADDKLLCEEKTNLFPLCARALTPVSRYVRGYYSDIFHASGTAQRETSLKDPRTEGADSSPEDPAAEIRRAHDFDSELRDETLSEEEGTFEAPLVWGDTFSWVQGLAKELDEPPDALLSTLNPISNLTGDEMEFLPSSLSDQIREELEGGGCLEEAGGDLWAEYSKFVAELP
ncbi:ankyrin repeat protein [Colletotrichum asianum]|uniref:Multiple ankyrin repeats single kh domain-containing protein n=1 Tax=Colletotrichum asianum TaxID=702518 RepID=A0A8H3WD47_9PEZI|nr:multiple ankyrin repeats single kh domain-containing protein [Colletotrichum asianum]